MFISSRASGRQILVDAFVFGQTKEGRDLKAKSISKDCKHHSQQTHVNTIAWVNKQPRKHDLKVWCFLWKGDVDCRPYIIPSGTLFITWEIFGEPQQKKDFLGYCWATKFHNTNRRRLCRMYWWCSLLLRWYLLMHASVHLQYMFVSVDVSL